VGPDGEGAVETDEATITDDAELERTLGLAGGLAIGIGTMTGAGMFVFPRSAGSEVGTAATASFGVWGGLVALLVALPTSELATAMPKSGGSYYFISRGLGTLPGTVVGLSLWLGLVFATALYLVGLGFYALDELAEVGITVGASSGVIVSAVAVVAGIGFTVLNVTGTENAAELQNGTVALLLSMLVAFPAFGMLDSLGIFDAGTPPGEAKNVWGVVPILSVAALVFTSIPRLRTGRDRRRRDEESGEQPTPRYDRFGPDGHGDVHPHGLRRDERLHTGRARSGRQASSTSSTAHRTSHWVWLVAP